MIASLSFSFSSKSQLFQQNKVLTLEAGGTASPALHSGSEMGVQSELLSWGSPLRSGLGSCAGMLLERGSRGLVLGFLLLLARACGQACFTSRPGWRQARMPSLDIALLPESNGFLSASKFL